VISTLSERVLRELAFFTLGEELGSGMSRTVFIHPFDETKVIKVENSSTNFQNVLEWQFWQDYKHCNNISKWLAPCHAISDSGTFLIMSRTEPVPKVKIPKKLPKFLTDHKPENIGLLNNRIVCHDYAFTISSVEDRLVKWKG
jgi:hypothetical protein